MEPTNHLDSFITCIESEIMPDDKTLKQIADSLKAMKNGSSFKAAFKLTNKRGRKPIKPLFERDLEEVKPYLDGIHEFYKKIKQGENAAEAKANVCKKMGICERNFDDYRAGYNKIKNAPFKFSPEENKLPPWQIMSIAFKYNFYHAQKARKRIKTYEALLLQIRKEYQVALESQNYDHVKKEKFVKQEAFLLEFIKMEKDIVKHAHKTKKYFPAF